jgi:hypothetical protein
VRSGRAVPCQQKSFITRLLKTSVSFAVSLIDVMERARLVYFPFQNDAVKVGIPFHQIAKRLV